MTIRAKNNVSGDVGALWVRLALVKTGAGISLGIVTAFVLVVISRTCFPGLADFDYDIGLRMHNLADYVRHRFRGAGMVPEPGQTDAYVFIDVDPQLEATASAERDEVGACQALARTYPDRYNTGVRCSGGSCINTVISLNCSQARPLNRYLLAEIIKGLRERGAGLIVVDVELAEEPGVVSAAENLALRDAMYQHTATTAPVVFVRPAEYDSHHPTGMYLVRSGPACLFDASLPHMTRDSAASGNQRSALPAVGLPAPGQPVRRYPKCFGSTNGEGPLPSVPYIAAALLAQPDADPGVLCPPANAENTSQDDGPYAAPRIRYTLPSLRGHQDYEGEDDLLWPVYRQVYNRCLGTQFWSAQSHCGRSEAYRGKVVVIGASSRLRRDRHYTPIGDMAGAEVVINAIRSFTLNPHLRDKSLLEAVWSKLKVVMVCGVPWFGFYCLRGYLFGSAKPASNWATRLRRGAAVFVAFWTTLFIVLWLTVMATYSSFSLLVGVLAIGVEQYVEAVKKWLLDPVERCLKKALGLPADSRAH